MGSILKADPECKPSLSLTWVFAGASFLISVFLPSSLFRLLSWKQPQGTGSQVTTLLLTTSNRTALLSCSHSVGPRRILIWFLGGFISSYQGSARHVVGPEQGPVAATGDFAVRTRRRAGDDGVCFHSPRCMHAAQAALQSPDKVATVKSLHFPGEETEDEKAEVAELG